MHESGVIDFQSHTSYHHSVFINDKLFDFINPNLVSSFLYSDLNCVVRKNNRDVYSGDYEWGQPVYQYAPSMIVKRRYIEDEKISKECISFVKTRGGKKFFNRKKWRSELLECYKTFSKKGLKYKYQFGDDRYREIKSDLLQARRKIEEKLRKKVQHLCYPWYVGSEMSVRASKNAGYLANYWGIYNKKAINVIGQSPMYLRRLSEDYIFALPGKGRKNLIAILMEKALRLIMQKQT